MIRGEGTQAIIISSRYSTSDMHYGTLVNTDAPTILETQLEGQPINEDRLAAGHWAGVAELWLIAWKMCTLILLLVVAGEGAWIFCGRYDGPGLRRVGTGGQRAVKIEARGVAF